MQFPASPGRRGFTPVFVATRGNHRAAGPCPYQDPGRHKKHAPTSGPVWQANRATIVLIARSPGAGEEGCQLVWGFGSWGVLTL
jgi:hypothetical protein